MLMLTGLGSFTDCSAPFGPQVSSPSNYALTDFRRDRRIKNGGSLLPPLVTPRAQGLSSAALLTAAIGTAEDCLIRQNPIVLATIFSNRGAPLHWSDRDAVPFGRLWYQGCEGRSWLRKVFQPITDAVIRVYDETGNVIETHEHAGDFKEWW